MKVLVSACLIGENCKYNGGNNLNEKLMDFLKDKEVISVCPEVLGGLDIPRNPGEIVEAAAAAFAVKEAEEKTEPATEAAPADETAEALAG